jgi:hypothetical protein
VHCYFFGRYFFILLLKGLCSMGFKMWFFLSAERVVALVKNSPIIKKAKFFSFLSFVALILSSCAMPAGDAQDVKNKEHLEQASATQAASNNKGANAVFSSDAFAAVRSSIDGAQLNELGDKIPTALAETAINKTENLINQKANEIANSVGQGKTEISLRQLETKNPEFSIKTIQPLTDLTDESTQLTFTQAQISSGENHGERRATINLGIGQRYLLEDGQSIAGINLFTDYETASKHSRASLGLEYQRANFSANVNKYYPLSNKVVIGDYTEEPLAGYDIRLTGQVPYLPWARIKGTQYHWDAITGDDIKGTSLGVEADINASTTFEIGTENSNTASRSGYARLRVQLPYNANPASTHFIITDKAFEDSTKLSLTHLNYVERSNKIRIEKLLNGVSVILGEYNAVTSGATCTLYNASDVAIANGSGVTGPDGMVTLSNVVLPTGFVYSACAGGTYIDEATGITTSGPNLRAGTIYSGTGDEIILASPVSEIAYQLAGDDLAGTITAKNSEVATAFGLNSVDIISTIPTDINTSTAANDDAGKFGTVLAAISQMGENAADANPTATITALVDDMKGSDGSTSGTIEGRDTGNEVVDIAKAITNFKTNSGDNNTRNGTGAEKIDLSTGEGSVRGSLAIAFIDAYLGTGTAPTVQQYVDAGVTGVTANNLAAVNAAVANQTAGTTAQIQALADRAIGINAQTRSIAENSANETNVGAVLTTIGSPTGFSITSGNTNDAFAISSAGQITVATTGELDFESTTSYTLTVEITKADTTSQSATITINVTDVVETATFTIDAIADTTVAENAVFTGSTPATSGTAPIGTLTYTLGGTDAADFTINSTTGVIAMVARDFEAPADADTDNAYEVTIIATDSDGNTDSEAQTVTVTDVADTFVSQSVSHGGLTYMTVLSPDTGKIWLDRNLGATRVATSSTDFSSYGDLYQWGRPADGHQLMTYTSATAGSPINGTDGGGADADRLSATITPGHGLFIEGDNDPRDWVSSGVDDDGDSRVTYLSKVDGSGICPSDFRLPTQAELGDDIYAGSPDGVTGTTAAFESFLNIPAGGYRSYGSGNFSSTGSGAVFWARDSNTGTTVAHYMYIHGTGRQGGATRRSNAFSVRCIGT